LSTKVKNLESTVKSALDWAENPTSQKVVGSSREAEVNKKLKKISWKTEKLKLSESKNSAVAVYGPSQAGKSFLVSVLAKPGNGSLIADFPGDNNSLNYIKEINPAGDTESTGIVTRFSSKKYKAQSDFPVFLKLLLEKDLICILMNSFFLDCDQAQIAELSREEIQARISKIKDTSRPKENEHLDIKDFWEIEDYLREKFWNFSNARTLANFCEQIGALAITLDLEERVKLYSLFWGDLEFYNKLFKELVADLERLQFASEVYAPLSALHPKSESIIDVKELFHLLSSRNHEVEVQVNQAHLVPIKRQNLTALTAELWVPLQKIPHQFLQHTDLLDFPGARNRFPRDPSSLKTNKLDDLKTFADMFLRGKVAFLFDRYVSDKEITAMISCIPDGNMEQVDLPELLNSWISGTVGERPKDRDEQKNPLFFVMTKFDLHLQDTAAAVTETDRFSRRIRASLLEKFGQGQQSWPLHWNSSSKFHNCFWLRNFEVDQVFHSKDQEGKEFIDPNKLERLQEFEKMFLATPEVQDHFKDPKVAWDAAIEPNDGGVKYLANALSEHCTADLKNNQLEQQLRRQKRELYSLLENFYVPDEFDERLKVQKQRLSAFESRFKKITSSGKFNIFLEMLCLDPKYFKTLYMKDNNAAVDKFGILASEIWTNQITSHFGEFERQLHLNIEDAEFLRNEILMLCKRTKIAEKIDDKIAGWNIYPVSKLKRQIACEMTCALFNELINSFCFSSNGRNHDAKSINIPKTPSDPSELLGNNWISNFGSRIEDNCRMSGDTGQTIDPENNRKLGQLLSELS